MKTNNNKMTNLTNTELQAAIDAAELSRYGRQSPIKEHLKALLAEQIRRLNAEENAVKIEPAVEEWEYVLAYWSEAQSKLKRTPLQGSQPRSSSYMIRFIFKMLYSDELSSSREYGVYQRIEGTRNPWLLVTDNTSNFPKTVEEIN